MNEPTPAQPDLHSTYLASLKDMTEVIKEAEKNGVQLSELRDTDKAQTLVIQTGSGTINLNRNPEDEVFNVTASEDPSMEAGDTVALDGASVSGVGDHDGLFAPGTRLTFRKRLPTKYFKFGEENTDTTIKRETYERIIAPGDIKSHILQEDGRVAMRIFDPTVRSTNFVAHAQLLNEDGVRELF